MSFLEKGSLSSEITFHKVSQISKRNGKLCDDLLNVEIFNTLLEARVLIECWRREYNTVRSHSSLGYRPPAPETILPLAACSATLGNPPAEKDTLTYNPVSRMGHPKKKARDAHQTPFSI